MRRSVGLVWMICAGLWLPLSGQDGLNNDRLLQLFDRHSLEWEGEPGSWLVTYQERVLVLLTDEPNNRLRIFTPIIRDTDVSPGEMRRMLEANFHSALDSKYSIYEGFVVSVFTHPFAELSSGQLLDALRQVANLAASFGTTYSSSDLLFQPTQPSEEEQQKPPPGEKRS